MLIENSWITHQVSHVTEQQQTSAGKLKPATVGGMIGPVVPETPGHLNVTLLESLFQFAGNQSETVAIDLNFVFSVHCSNRVLAILNRGHCRLKNDIFDPC